MRIVLKSTLSEETAHKVMRAFGRSLALAVTLALTLAGPGRAADTIRLAVQKTGTFSWELAAIRAGGLDKEADLSLDVTELASPRPARSRCAPAMPTSSCPTGCGYRASARSAPSSPSIPIPARSAR